MHEKAVSRIASETSRPSGGFFVAEGNGPPVHEIAWVLGHVSADGIVSLVHALTLHRLLCGSLALEVRVGKKLTVKVSKANVSDRTR